MRTERSLPQRRRRFWPRADRRAVRRLSVTEYAPGSSGDATPVAKLQGSSTGLSGPDAVAFDATGRMYIANAAAGTVTEYAPGARGNATPVATIAGAATKLNEPLRLGFDSAGNLYVVDFSNVVAVFSPGANGNLAPLRLISGGATGLSGPQSIAVVPPLSILTKRLPAGTVGHLYRKTLRAALGTTPYRWFLKRGRLPRSFRLTRSGKLSGVPHRPGRWRFTIRVADAGQPPMTDRRTFMLTVRCPLTGRTRSCAVRRRARRHALLSDSEYARPKG
jgi:hypothetical protein